GRIAEVRRLRALVEDLAAGRGAAVWVYGEPGIGKTTVLTAALADADGAGCQVAWGAADDLDRFVPLRGLAHALGGGASAADPQTAGLDEIASPNRILAYVRALCTRAPLLLVVDDLNRADEASLLLWHRLIAASRRMPLLLVAAVETEHGRPDLARLRQ